MSHPSAASASVALVTGAGGTFGRHIVLGLLRGGFSTTAVVRDAEKASALAAWISARRAGAPASAGGSLSTAVCDLSDGAAVASLGASLPALDVLVSNAALVPARRCELRGVEAQWSVGVLGYHRLLRACLPALRAAHAPRVVLVASHYAGGLDLADAEFRARPYAADAAYRASKQADRMLARAWAAREPRLAVYACHPGVAASAVARGLGFDFDAGEAAAAAGAVTPVFCATAPRAALAPSGAYYADCAPARCRFGEDAAACEALAAMLDAYDDAADLKE